MPLDSNAVPANAPDVRLVLGLLRPEGATGLETVAERLGVASEAVAAALDDLTAEGLAEPTSEGGYRLPRLDASELRELYPAALMLECLAVREAPDYDAETLAALRAANDRLRAAADPVAAMTADDDFHTALLRHCDNERLLDVLRPVRRALLRYERAYMVEPARIERSAAQHEAIVAALEHGDRAGAAQGVRENFMQALPDLEAQIVEARREAPPPASAT
jgi:DNA-binding GntR family transcriptional regulator